MATRKRSAKTSADAKRSKPTPPVSMETLKDWVRTSGMAYLQDPNITSVGIGRKITDGETTDEIALVFTVGEKAVPEALDGMDTEPIPASIEIDGVAVPTDVLERSYAAEYTVVAEAAPSERLQRLDTIAPGISVSHARGTAGTIGCIVYDAVDGTPYILSNWHVLHGLTGAIGDDVVQPGPADDNRVHLNHVGKLVRSHLGLAGDCALASIDGRGIEPSVLDLDTVVDRIGEPELDDIVVKSGRTSGVTYGKVVNPFKISTVDYRGAVGEQAIESFEIEIDPAHQPPDGEISGPGDSGAAWLFTTADAKPSSVMAGLHFGGEATFNPREYAIACFPKSVFKRLGVTLNPPPVPQASCASAVGYDRDFLAKRVALPSLTKAGDGRVVQVDGSEVIDYTHFSLAMNGERRFAYWVAWNIDGGGLIQLDRKGIPFVLDPRLPSAAQAGDELYAGNRLDRGHLARRADLLWGGMAEAEQANIDSFFFTNITPQMDDFNQSSKAGLWGRLENALFEDVEVEDLKVSVFAGPVFRDDDRLFRNVRLPREFWKVIAFVEAGKLQASGFILTQSLDQLEALDLNEFRVFQVALTEIEARCDLRFPRALKSADTEGERLAARPEALGDRKPLDALADIAWS